MLKIKELILSQLLAVLALLVFFSAPVFAEEDPATCHAIVSDYKTVQSMFKAGQINQQTLKAELKKLEARAGMQLKVENFNYDKQHGYLPPNSTKLSYLNKRFGLEPICENQEEYLLFEKILQGYAEEPI